MISKIDWRFFCIYKCQLFKKIKSVLQKNERQIFKSLNHSFTKPQFTKSSHNLFLKNQRPTLSKNSRQRLHDSDDLNKNHIAR